MNIKVNHSSPVVTPQSTQKPATPEKPTQIQQAAEMAKDGVSWSNTAKTTRVGAAIKATFAETAVPYAIGGTVAVPLAGAAAGAFMGMFGGRALEGAKLGFMATLKYAPVGTAVGLGAAGAQSLVTGTVVGTAPNKEAAVMRMGSLTAILGALNAEDASDLIGVAGDTVYEATLAGRVFDKAEAAVTGK